MNRQWDNLKLKSVVNFNLAILKVCGYWWPDDEKDQKNYTIYAMIVLSLTFFVYMITEGLSNFFALNDLIELTDSCFLFLTHVSQLAKCYVFTVHHKRVQRLIDGMGIDLFRPRYPKQIKTMEESTRKMKVIYQGFLWSGVMVCVLWAIFPYLDTEGLKLPLSAWYPFDTDGYLVFPIIFGLQIFWATLNAVINITVDSTVSACISSICDQLVLLNDSFENIKNYCEFEEQAAGPVFEGDYNDRLQRRMDAELRRCIVHHKAILRMVKEIHNLFSYVLLGQFALTVIIVCITMFKLTVVPFGSIQFLSLVLYQSSMLTEILLYCWFGNEVILKSSQLPISVYNSDWTNCTLNYKRNLLIIMIRTKVPITIYAGYFSTLSLETFTNILRTSWSYFAVLEQVHHGK